MNDMQIETAEVSYKLSKTEIEQGLRLSNMLKSHVGTSILETGLAAVALIVIILNIISNPVKVINYMLAIVCVGMIIYVWTFPTKRQKRVIDRALDEISGTINISFRKDAVIFSMDGDEDKEEVSYASVRLYDNETLIALALPRDKLLIVPKRVMDEENLQLALKYIKRYA